MGKHTPGPWTATETLPGVWMIDAGDVEVAEVWTDEGEPDGDPHLIAAAPDLLEALEGLFLDGAAKHPDTFRADFDRARAAIAKAKGAA